VLGIAMAVSSLFVRYRDVEPIWDVVTQITFYGSPILYTLSLVADKAGPEVAHLLAVNPFTAALQQARHAMFGDGHPSAAESLGGDLRLLLPLGITLVTFAIGFVIFDRRAARIAEDL
jgi:ABC-2 type transport system permease protein